MFFWIQGVLDLTQSSQFDAIENLGEAGFAGRHVVLGDKPVIDLIAAEKNLSRKARTYFLSVKAKYTQVAALKRLLPKIIVSPSCLVANKADEWVVPLDSFRTDDSVEKALIIVEHMYDYKVIEGLAKTSLRESGINGWIGLSLVPLSGGGGGTSLTLSVHQKNTRSIGICVVDSDRVHVKAALGSTARGCEKVYQQRWGWGLHIIGGRELENLVPPEIFLAGGVNFKLATRGYYRAETWAIHGYADTKKGDCLCRFRAIDRGDQSYGETAIALGNLPVTRLGVVCPSEACVICEVNDSALSVLAQKMDAHPIAGLRRLPSSVEALSALLKDVIGYGAAPRWSMI